MSTVCLFEDDGWRGLLPFTWLRPCWEMVTGTRDTLARVRAAFDDAAVRALCRPWLEAVVRERSGLTPCGEVDGVLFVNGRLVDVEAVARHARETDGPFALWKDDSVAAFRLDRSHGPLPDPAHLTGWVRSLSLPAVSSSVTLFRRWWDLVYLNGDVLSRELQRYPLGVYEGTLMSGVYLLDAAKVYVGAGAELAPGVIIDSRGGAVVVDRTARVGSGSLVVGPSYIGRDSVVKPFSHIGPEVTIGPHCRVGGEVARCVFAGYGNKQHHGFLGHAYVGPWVNLGAGTTNSNLKNTYGHVNVWVDGRLENSGLTFVGCGIGDHAKTAINTSLNTGSVIGVSANVFTRGFPPKFVPSFSWGPSPGREYEIGSALTTAARVMERRGVELTAAEAALLRSVWERSAPERAALNGDVDR